MTQVGDSYCAVGIHKSSVHQKKCNIGVQFTSENIAKIIDWEMEMKNSILKVRDFNYEGKLLDLNTDFKKEAVVEPKVFLS